MERRSFLTIAASVAFVPAPNSTPYKSPEYVRGLASRLAASREHLGGTPLVSTALRYVKCIEGAINSSDWNLQAAASELSRISSLVMRDAEKSREAGSIATLALAFARRANNPRSIAQNYENLSMLSTASDPVLAAHYARRGLEVPDLPKENKARLTARLGTALARDRRNARSAEKFSRSALETARTMDALPVDTAALVLASSGLSDANLKRYQEADSALTDAVRMFSDRPLLSADWRTRQIMATLTAGNVDRAAEQMTSLASVVPLVTSARLDKHIRDILAFSAQWDRAPEMRNAIGHLRSVAGRTTGRTI